jgi:hypothetical protein
LISQFVTQVTISPFGFFVAVIMLEKSIFSIIGYIMSHIRIATGIDTFAYSNLLKVSGITGINCLMATPTIIHAATHSVRYFSKKTNPLFSCITSLLLKFYASNAFNLICPVI